MTTALASWSVREGRWREGRASERGGPPAVADSWLLCEGAVRGWELHRARFIESCVAKGASRATLERLWSALPDVLPRKGEWFPRLEMPAPGGAEFLLRVRLCPPRWEQATVWLTDQDPRSAPRVKGPDIESLMGLRDAARALGAEEAVIANARGEPIEAAGCSIAWWRDDALHLVRESEPILDGVTCKLLRKVASQRGVEVRQESMPASAVGRFETWLLNALIGIVPVAGWVERCPRTPIDQARLAQWRRCLDDLAKPIDSLVAPVGDG